MHKEAQCQSNMGASATNDGRHRGSRGRGKRPTPFPGILTSKNVGARNFWRRQDDAIVAVALSPWTIRGVSGGTHDRRGKFEAVYVGRFFAPNLFEDTGAFELLGSGFDLAGIRFGEEC